MARLAETAPSSVDPPRSVPMRRIPTAARIATVSLLMAPGLAQAHLVSSGLGPFYDGVLHLLLSPGDLLGVVVLALLAGLRGARAGRLTVMLLPAVWMLAGLVGLALPAALEPSMWGVLFLTLLGVGLAANLRLPPPLLAGLAGVYGGLHGLMNGSTLTAIGAGWPGLVGIVTAVLLLGLLLAALALSLRADWTRTAVRVVGSWVAAVGLLMLGWMVQGVS